ncbi:hypothetical protein VTH82DRAFT_7422 [Thermothelomyces myriococcoides]
MLPGVTAYNSALALLLCAALSRFPSCAAAPRSGFLSRRFDLILDYSPAPPPEEGPPISAGALRDPAYLPAQIGGIVGAYALSLVLVAILLLVLSKRRREHLENRDKPPEEQQGGFFAGFNPFPQPFLLQSEEEYKKQLEAFQRLTELEQQQQFHFFKPQREQSFQQLSLEIPTSPARNLSFPSASPLSPTRTGPLSPTKSQRSAVTSSPTSTVRAPGLEHVVDKTVLQRDRTMAQQQLENMYKYVMEHEQAKAEGREYEGPPLPVPSSAASPAKASKKEKNKPSSLNLSRDDKGQSRGSSFLSFLKSPRKSKMNANVTISSPILTPMSGTFPRRDDQEMSAMQPRQYAPAAPPPVPSSSDVSFRRAAGSVAGSTHHHQPPSPDISPVSSQSIDSRIDAAIGKPPSKPTWREQHEREGRSGNHNASQSVNPSPTSTTGDHEPVSASSEQSTTRLVGLPASPRPNATRFPSEISLPASPRPQQQSFQQQPAPNSNGNSNESNNNNNSTSSLPRPSAVREGGTLPLRAYEPSVASPTSGSFATKQTVFTRAEVPLSPGTGLPTGARTPWTGAPAPYSPYQPFSPVVPITPSVVTKEDRKRMKKLEPRTPTLEMVRSTEEMW